MTLTEQEKNLIELIREEAVKHGRIILEIIFQDNKILRAEVVEKRKSVKL